jgi:hypothetical protein
MMPRYVAGVKEGSNIMRNYLSVTCLLLVALCLGPVPSVAQEGVCYAFHTATPPVIDGSDGDACWADSNWTDAGYGNGGWVRCIYVNEDPAGGLPLNAAWTAFTDGDCQYKVVWSESTPNDIYWLVKVTDDFFSYDATLLWNFAGSLPITPGTGFHTNAYQEDVVELFIDPSSTRAGMGDRGVTHQHYRLCLENTADKSMITEATHGPAPDVVASAHTFQASSLVNGFPAQPASGVATGGTAYTSIMEVRMKLFNQFHARGNPAATDFNDTQGRAGTEHLVSLGGAIAYLVMFNDDDRQVAGGDGFARAHQIKPYTCPQTCYGDATEWKNMSFVGPPPTRAKTWEAYE